jgi:hypothetical protein
VQRIAIRSSVVAAAVVLGCLGVSPSANAVESCAGATASSLARQVSFGTRVVAPDAHNYNFGQDVVTPLARAPHEACPRLPS